MQVAFSGYLAFGGMGGWIMSESMTLYWESWRRRSATRGPRKPAPPVMRILGIVVILN